MSHLDDRTRKALKFDGLAEAEKLTGRSYKDDPLTSGLGFMMHTQNIAQRKALLSEQADSYYGIGLEQYLDIVKDIGFRPVLLLPIKYIDKHDGLERNETMYVMWHDAGVMLRFDTFSLSATDLPGLNGGDFGYNWKPSREVVEQKQYRHFTSSGHWARTPSPGPIEYGDIYAGSHDCREGIRFHFEQLATNGEFITPWVEPGLTWLCHYVDHKREDIKSGSLDMLDELNRLTLERWEMLPDDVKAATACWPEAIRKKVYR